MEISASNRLRGRVKSVKLGADVATVTVDVDGQEIEAVISRDSVQRLRLEEGQSVIAAIRSTDVMLIKPSGS
jgi:molybdopterin-binding protein